MATLPACITTPKPAVAVKFPFTVIMEFTPPLAPM